MDTDDLGNWSTLLDTVDKTDIPIKFVRGVNITFKDSIHHSDDEYIDIHKLRNDGWNDGMLNDLVKTWLEHEPDKIQRINFIIDVEYIAKNAQHHTDTYLMRIK